MAKPHIAEALAPGTHGSTFGGNPVACSAALAVLQTIEEDNILDHVTRGRDAFRCRAQTLAAEVCLITNVRGRGLMVAAELIARRPHGRQMPGARLSHQLHC